ncbi:beta-galactosidase alpha-peptide [Streptomyces viridosporus ATCC 14672]|uniref:Beta-galactosidase alpha-peptide n=1 Tax=Streptomyces viridosporus (strain ATCC 14672 / DSM 40746 / JCM 4963 / KCTC 9882 / NRRL B-12104 / FH 1290) TaxID=566461 RepID=D6A0I0_STRV1|nr:beta-galactosidase alpha-peptide [Streptomyces viridosporus ATCC 14672]
MHAQQPVRGGPERHRDGPPRHQLRPADLLVPNLIALQHRLDLNASGCEEARTDRPSQQLRSLNGEWRLMRYFLLTHLCGISHRIWCTLSTICSDAA